MASHIILASFSSCKVTVYYQGCPAVQDVAPRDYLTDILNPISNKAQSSKFISLVKKEN